MAGLCRGSLAASAIVLSFGVLKSPQKVVNASVEAPLLPGKKRLTFCFSIQMSKISGSLGHLPLGMVPLGGKRRLYSSHLIQSRGKFSLFSLSSRLADSRLLQRLRNRRPARLTACPPGERKCDYRER